MVEEMEVLKLPVIFQRMERLTVFSILFLKTTLFVSFSR